MTGRPRGSRIGAAALWFFPLRLFLVMPPKHPVIAISDNRFKMAAVSPKISFSLQRSVTMLNKG